MTLQESQLLQDCLDQLAQIRGVRKDPEAQAMIQKALAQQPDANTVKGPHIGHEAAVLGRLP